MTRRNSVQKQVITDALLRLDHPTAPDILKEVRKKYPRISLGTVYRNLNLLVEDGALKRLSFHGSPDRFDVVLSLHHHMQCRRCGLILDVEVDYPKEIDQAVEQSTGFVIESRNIFYKGLCPLCNKKENTKIKKEE